MDSGATADSKLAAETVTTLTELVCAARRFTGRADDLDREDMIGFPRRSLRAARAGSAACQHNASASSQAMEARSIRFVGGWIAQRAFFIFIFALLFS